MPRTSPPVARPVVCQPCGLRFMPSALPLCPECQRPMMRLASAEEALGLRLYRPVDISLPALAAAIAARPEAHHPPYA